MCPNYVTLDQKNYLLPFTFEQENLQSDYLTKESIGILHNICDANTYLKALQKSGVDKNAMPFSNLDRKNLYSALEVL